MSKGNKGKEGCFAVLLVVAVYAAILGLMALAVQELWNWVVVGLFGAKTIGYGLGIGIVLLLILLGSFFRSSSK